jgi:hypothetical protein
MQYIQEIRQILAQARQKSYQAINTAMVEAYWKIGQKIVIEEQNGNDRATFGEAILKELFIQLTREFGKGFSAPNLKNFKHLYLNYPEG